MNLTAPRTITMDGLPGLLVTIEHQVAAWAVEKAAQEAFDRAVSMSSGPATYADLRRADHPYAVRHGRPLWQPWIINAHTGAFRDHWQKVKVDDLEQHVINDSPVADFLQFGTDRMFPRPIVEAVETVTEFDLGRQFRMPRLFM